MNKNLYISNSLYCCVAGKYMCVCFCMWCVCVCVYVCACVYICNVCTGEEGSEGMLSSMRVVSREVVIEHYQQEQRHS